MARSYNARGHLDKPVDASDPLSHERRWSAAAPTKAEHVYYVQGTDDLGLINMVGRIYDPLQKRFLTPDPLIAQPLSGQSYNRFS